MTAPRQSLHLVHWRLTRQPARDITTNDPLGDPPRPPSNRNGGRFQIGMGGRFQIGIPGRLHRNPQPGTGRIGILLPDGLLGNPSDEYVRWWILRNCEVLASVDLPIEPFKVTLKDYRLTPALPTLLVLRRRSHDELMHTTHPDYWVFMAVASRAGVDARGNQFFERAPNGEQLFFDEEVIERVRVGGQVQSRAVVRRQRHIADELPVVAGHYREFVADGRSGL